MENDKDLKILAKFKTEQEAHLLRGELNANGVPAIVSGDGGVGFVGLSSPGFQAIHLNVRQIDYQRAKELMEAFNNQEPRELVPSWKCNCGEQVDEGFYICWSCGKDYEDVFGEPPVDTSENGAAENFDSQ